MLVTIVGIDVAMVTLEVAAELVVPAGVVRVAFVVVNTADELAVSVIVVLCATVLLTVVLDEALVSKPAVDVAVVLVPAADVCWLIPVVVLEALEVIVSARLVDTLVPLVTCC